MVVGEGESSMDLLLVFPNPAQHWIALSGTQPGSFLSVHDMMGRCIWQSKASRDTLKLDVHDWARGTYTLHAEGIGGRQSFKFVLIE